MNKRGSIKVSKDIIECIRLLALKENMDLKIYIEVILMKHYLRESIKNK